MTWLSEIGVDSWRYRQLSMRRSNFFSGAYNGRRLKPTAVTGMDCPFAVTENRPVDGVRNVKALLTRLKLVGVVEPDAALLMFFNSSNVGVITCNVYSPG